MCQSDSKGDLPAWRNRTTSFLELLLAQYETYHNHKENMAHAGFLLQLGALVAVIAAEKMPPDWIMNSLLYPRLHVTIIVVATWFITSIFIRWQLINRRIAALLFAAILSTLRDWAVKQPTEEELRPATKNESNNDKIPWWRRVLSLMPDLLEYLLPLGIATPHSDVPLDKYPVGLNNRLKKQKKKGTGAFKSEIFLFIAGAVLLALAIRRIWL
jgi:hypothetical protein